MKHKSIDLAKPGYFRSAEDQCFISYLLPKDNLNQLHYLISEKCECLQVKNAS